MQLMQMLRTRQIDCDRIIMIEFTKHTIRKGQIR